MTSVRCNTASPSRQPGRNGGGNLLWLHRVLNATGVAYEQSDADQRVQWGKAGGFNTPFDNHDR